MYEVGADGIAVLTLDDPSPSVNAMNARFTAALSDAVDRGYADRERLIGVVVTSAKSTFVVGGDLAAMMRATPRDAERVFAEVERLKMALRRLETLGVPVVAALNGSALGGGLEIALACHHRVAVDDGRSEFGLPEVTLGLLPGAGGVTRTVRMLGLVDALTDVLLRGQRHRPARAHALGLVDELVPDLAALLPAAKRWLLAHRDDPDVATQPWDRPGYRIPGGVPSSPALAAVLPAFPARLRKQLNGAPYPAPRAIMAAAVEGSQVGFETASRIESRYFTGLVTGPISTNLIRALFFDLQAVNSGAGRPGGVERFAPRKAGVLGAGMMGAGIALACAEAGMSVMLGDTDGAAMERGMAHAGQVTAASVRRGSIDEQQRAETLARITTTSDTGDLVGCDLVIEAVFEDAGLKKRVLAEAENAAAPHALLCSNTSALPISELASGLRRPADLVGLHFFSPVGRMPLVEIVVGKETSDEAVARAHDVVRCLGKTPIIVNDSRGFFTSRVFGTFVLEGAAMLAEGVQPMTIERAAMQAGFSSPPLALLDEVTLTLPQRTRDAAAGAALAAFDDHPGMVVVDAMVALGRRGRSSGAGFYDYPDEGAKTLWPGLGGHFAPSAQTVDAEGFRNLQDRLLFVMSLESIRCLDDGVLRSTADANVGSILGIGFPALYGGALQFVNGYDGGPRGFLVRAQELAEAHGARFSPPSRLCEMAKTGGGL